MNRMELDSTIRDRVASALFAYEAPDRFPLIMQERLRDECGRRADRALAALGLDDLDAAVERAAEWLGGDTTWARSVLEAALTSSATPDSEAANRFHKLERESAEWSERVEKSVRKLDEAEVTKLEGALAVVIDEIQAGDLAYALSFAKHALAKAEAARSATGEAEKS